MPDRWNRRVRAALTERLGYKVAALFFAVALWVAASGEEEAAHYLTVRFVPVLDSSVRLVGAPPAMRALVVGPTRELLKLSNVPPVVRRAFGAGTPGEVTVEVRPSDVDLPTGVGRVIVRDVEPRAVVLHFQTTHATLP